MQPTEKNITDLQNKLWYIIKHEEGNNTNTNQITQNTNEDYTICLNDIIKLGRVKYSANEINFIKEKDQMEIDQTGTNVYNITDINQGTQPVFDFIYKTTTIEMNTADEHQCKICLSGGSDLSNPLVTLCKCTGGIKYTHYDCLKRWMHTKLSKKENEKKTVTSYNIKSFNCEICKTPYPFRFVITNNDINSNNTYDLIEIVRPIDKSFIILESLNQVKDNNNVKSIHVIILDGDKITLGRGHEADVRINDISVSRQHAVLIYDSSSGKINIRDLKSKFGTLTLIKNDLKIKEKKNSIANW